MPFGTVTPSDSDDAASHVLVERDRQRERVGAGVGDAEHLADGRDASLAGAADRRVPSAKLKTRSGGFFRNGFDERAAVAEFHDGVAE